LYFFRAQVFEHLDRILLANAEQQDCATAHAGITHR
jgi:hypothetical protein